MMELTTSPTVRADCFFSAFWRCRMSHQSMMKMATLSTLMPQHTPMYLKCKFLIYLSSKASLTMFDSLVSEHDDVVEEAPAAGRALAGGLPEEAG